ncbi:MAG: SCO family protein [Planctomycetota bacterium]|jgi:protein SCO1/2
MRYAPLLLLLACREPVDQPKAEPIPKTDALTIPDFSFQEVFVGSVGRKDLLGKVWVAATVFTFCPTHCPAMTQEMYDLQKEFGGEPDFKLLTLSIDPARDTVPVLKKFAESYYAKPGTWYFARHPDRKVLRSFVVDGLKIAWDEDEPLNHSYRLVLVDRSGKIRGWFKRTEKGKMGEMRATIRELLAEKSSS